MKPIFLTLAILLSMGSARAANRTGCTAATYYLGILELYNLDPSARDAQSLARELKVVKTKLCADEYSDNESVYYPNGKLATHYANREDATWYWPNGRQITSYAIRESASVYYPNGVQMTSYFLRVDASYYHSNGKSLSSYIGRKGATLYDFSGGTLTSRSPGFEVNGHLDFLAMVDYVTSRHVDSTPPTDCSRVGMRSNIEKAIDLIQTQKNNQAVDVLRVVQSCL